MLSRLLHIPQDAKQSAFIFGPRGTGKTAWLKQHFADACYIDLLYTETYTDLLANPSRLEKRIPPGTEQWVIIDEIQKIPELLNEVHRLIEHKGYRFLLTGSSARRLRRSGVNLLAGRALSYHMHPFIQQELGTQFTLEKALHAGLLPQAYLMDDFKHYLTSYVATYLREEVLQEGLLRQIGDFTRFLETASFSQGGVLNFSAIAREVGIDRKVVSEYFSIVYDLLIGFSLPPFTKRAKRRLVQHEKFYFFDVGVFRTLRPMGPLDSAAEAEGPGIETLFLQHLRAINDYYRLGFTLYYWRTATTHLEVDFVAYGEKGLYAFEMS